MPSTSNQHSLIAALMAAVLLLVGGLLSRSLSQDVINIAQSRESQSAELEVRESQSAETQVDARVLEIEMPDGAKVPVPTLVLAPSLVVEERQRLLPELAGRIGVDQFSRNSIHAPVMIQIESINNSAGERLAHGIHSAFVAYAPFDKLRDEQLLQQLFGNAIEDSDQSNKQGTADRLSDEVLKALNIVPPTDAEQYRFVSIPLLNEVQVQGTLYVRREEGTDWVRLTWLLDPRFEQANEYSNRSSKEIRDELGRASRTPSVPYSGLGGQLQVLVTNAETHQLVFESQMILHEPQDWFAGDNFLRAKLPLAIQENARKFRRELAKTMR